jgi:hypothetical protein
MDCITQPVNGAVELGKDLQETDPYYQSTVQIIRHHIYEYEKGLRDLILHTTRKDFRELAIDILNKKSIAYFISPAGDNNINIFFGNKLCIDVIKAIGKENLAEYTDEEDFILGTMLGYCRLKQCRRYLERRGSGC